MTIDEFMAKWHVVAPRLQRSPREYENGSLRYVFRDKPFAHLYDLCPIEAVAAHEFNLAPSGAWGHAHTLSGKLGLSYNDMRTIMHCADDPLRALQEIVAEFKAVT